MGEVGLLFVSFRDAFSFFGMRPWWVSGVLGVLAIGSSDPHLVGTASVPRLPSGQVGETYISPLPLGTMCPPPVGLRGGWGGGEMKR